MDVSKFTKNGRFLMLALDHRDSFRKMLNPLQPQSVSDHEIVQLKSQIIASVHKQMSGFLIDVDHKSAVSAAEGKPYLLAIEKSGYGDENTRVAELEHTATELKSIGASGVKLLLYINPLIPAFENQLTVAKKVREDCEKNDMPLFLELVTFGEDEQNTKAKLILKTLEICKKENITPSVFKLEYPGDLESCRTVTRTVGTVPWIVLTRGDPFELFKRHLQDAVIEGASGFLAGRALFQEAGTLTGDKRDAFIKNIIPHRFGEICEIAINNSFLA